VPNTSPGSVATHLRCGGMLWKHWRQWFSGGKEKTIQTSSHVFTSFTAHMRAIEPMLFVIVTSVAFARSALLAFRRRSSHAMCPKLPHTENEWNINHCSPRRWTDGVHQDTIKIRWHPVSIAVSAINSAPHLWSQVLRWQRANDQPNRWQISYTTGRYCYLPAIYTRTKL